MECGMCKGLKQEDDSTEENGGQAKRVPREHDLGGPRLLEAPVSKFSTKVHSLQYRSDIVTPATAGLQAG